MRIARLSAPCEAESYAFRAEVAWAKVAEKCKFLCEPWGFDFGGKPCSRISRQLSDKLKHPIICIKIPITSPSYSHGLPHHHCIPIVHEFHIFCWRTPWSQKNPPNHPQEDSRFHFACHQTHSSHPELSQLSERRVTPLQASWWTHRRIPMRILWVKATTVNTIHFGIAIGQAWAKGQKPGSCTPKSLGWMEFYRHSNWLHRIGWWENS